MHPDPLVLAYLAGAIDADGHITIQRSLRKVGKRYRHRPTYYFPKMGYTSTNGAVPDLLKQTFGGAVHHYRPSNARHKPVQVWYIGTAQCGIAARLLTPFLRQKVEQAVLVAELCEIIARQHIEQTQTQKPPYRITPEHLAVRERYWEEVTLLNEPSNRRVHFLGKRRAGRELDGRTWDEMPEGHGHG
jgi:hypothetical protein